MKDAGWIDVVDDVPAKFELIWLTVVGVDIAGEVVEWCVAVPDVGEMPVNGVRERTGMPGTSLSLATGRRKAMLAIFSSTR